MTARPPALADVVPTVEQTDGLLAVFEFEPGRTEVFHRGAWLLVEDLQAGAEGTIYVTLEGPVEARSVPLIDPDSGEISSRSWLVKTFPVIVATPPTLFRAQRRSVLLEGVPS